MPRMSTDSGNAEMSATTPFKVLMGNLAPELGELVGKVVGDVIGTGCHVQLVMEGDADEVRARAAREHFDLFVVVLNNVLHLGETPGERVVSLDKSVALVAELRAQAEAPIVVLSGGWRNSLEHEVEQAGADIFFLLPFDPQKLLELLALRLGRRE